MEYTDARCGSCGTWRTALVGYGGARVCLTCGAALDAGSGAGALTRFSAGALLDEVWARGGDPGHEARKERLRYWLQGQSITLPDEYVEVLAHCDHASEVRFALPIVTLSTWHPVGERSFSDGSWTLRLKQTVLGRRVGFVLEGPRTSRPVVVEIGGREDGDPDRRREDRLFTLELQAARYPVLRIPAERAEERGSGLRAAFMRDALEVIESAPPARPAARKELARTRRMWARHELVYDVAGLPREERRELVEDWLRSRGERLDAWQLDFLAGCERAAEVHFALPFLRLPRAEPADARTVHLDPWHTLGAQVVVDDYPVDFSFMTSLGRGDVVTTLVEIHPARGPRDREAERRRLREWRRDGHTVLALAAAEAGSHGRRWAESLLAETRGGRVLDAG